MEKAELNRIKRAFLPKQPKKEALSFEYKRRIIPKNILLLSSFLILLILTGVRLTSDNKTHNSRVVNPSSTEQVSSKENYPEEIRSLTLIEKYNNLTKLFPQFPLTIYGPSLKSLSVDFSKPIDLNRKSIRIFTANPGRKIGIILKDYTFTSNADSPITKTSDKDGVLSINVGNTLGLTQRLNTYKISQIRLIFYFNDKLSPVKIPKIDIVPIKHKI